MTRIVAAVDTHPIATRVVRTAATIADVIGAEVDIVHVRESDASEQAVLEQLAGHPVRSLVGDPAGEIVDTAHYADVALVVVGARSRSDATAPVGHITRAVLERAERPVVVVPPLDVPSGLRRALLPLEGSEVTSGTIDAVTASLVAGGVDVIPLHVFDDVTTPGFWDQAAHATDSYAASFSQRWSPCPGPVRLRRGDAGTRILEAAHDEDADLIVLGWRRDLTPGRAQVVQTTLRDSHVPVLLVPHPSG